MPPTTRFVLREQESALRPELDIAATRADVSLGPSRRRWSGCSTGMVVTIVPSGYLTAARLEFAASGLFANCPAGSAS